MRKKIASILSITIVLITLILPNYSKAEIKKDIKLSNYEDSSYDYDYEENYDYDYVYDEDEEYEYEYEYDYDYDYVIDSYNIDMTVNEDNTFDITETITTYFNEPKHGIYRKIPLRNSITRLDGTKSNNRAKISNINVSENYTTSNTGSYKEIKIGSAEETITGSHTYTIEYTYNIGNDPLKDADELYFNLIGDEWDTTISNVSFTITMPKSFDESLLGFSSGKTGSTDSSNVEYNVYDNIIVGTLYNELEPGEALTVRLTLPEGYFIKQKIKIDAFSVFVIIICISSIVVAYTLWKKHGKDEPVIETVEFYPPEGYNSAEIGFLYEGAANNEGTISLLIYLANKGYIKIEETEEKSSKKGFKIIKLKEYDGDNENERIFFEGLFEGEESDTKKEAVTVKDLKNKFYITLSKIQSNLNSKENKNKIFEEKATKTANWLILIIIAIFILITAKPVLSYNEDAIGTLIIALLCTGIGFTVLFSMTLGKTPISTKIFGLVWGAGFGGIPWAMMVLPGLLENIVYFVTYIIGIICIAVLVIFKNIMPKRTPYGNEMLGKIRGFRRFLETAEKAQLESLVMENPEYFYNILPYTYALGVSDVWISQFETIAIEPPQWYDSRDDFSVHDFGMFMTSTMHSASSAMTSMPSTSSDGGSSSGGGSSGGGSGGGGGGSW